MGYSLKQLDPVLSLCWRTFSTSLYEESPNSVKLHLAASLVYTLTRTHSHTHTHTHTHTTPLFYDFPVLFKPATTLSTFSPWQRSGAFLLIASVICTLVHSSNKGSGRAQQINPDSLPFPHKENVPSPACASYCSFSSSSFCATRCTLTVCFYI